MTWEQRYHPLRREWVIVAAHRQNRPWNAEEVGPASSGQPAYVPDCYLCPSNSRVGGHRNPPYEGVFVFDNDHPCVGPLAPGELPEAPGVYLNRPATGLARVICYTPRHDLSLARLGPSLLLDLLRTWQDQYRELGSRSEVEHVLIFENRGEVVGVSNPHPHCQVYGTNFVFKTMAEELAAQEEYRQSTGRHLFDDILRTELEDGRRILEHNDSAVAFLPYFARYAYECYVAPRERHPSIASLSGAELEDLAAVLHGLLSRFDNLWKMPFPYVMVLHQAPTDGRSYPDHHFHIQFHPPLRKPNLLKYLAGPEVGAGGFISDTCPEDKAQELLAAGGPHYLEREEPL